MKYFSSFKNRLGQFLIDQGNNLRGQDSKIPFQVFLTDYANHINQRRLEHLASLNLPLEGKSVLEVGSGIGLHTYFFEERNCKIVSTDGRLENVEEMKRRFPHRDARVFNLLDFNSYSQMGFYDIIFCYGTLYHTPKPEEILRELSGLCREMILIETCVTPGQHMDVHLVREGKSINQAVDDIGCRPTRPWVMDKLRLYFGNAYVTRTQPNHLEFTLDWEIPSKGHNHRSVFIGSKDPLNNPQLFDSLPLHQQSI